MKRALVCGAGGFPSTQLRTSIGGHLVKKLKREGYWVRGVDIKHHEFAPTHALWNISINSARSTKTSYSTGQANEFLLLDLREPGNCRAALRLDGHPSTALRQSSGQGSGQAFERAGWRVNYIGRWRMEDGKGREVKEQRSGGCDRLVEVRQTTCNRRDPWKV
jgi:nucleoside-diphosphate-sugar epimerase